MCQATVREIPAAQAAGDDLKELQAQLERAHRTTEQKRTAAQDAQAALTALRARLDDAESELEERGRARQEVQDRFVSRFPGYASLSAALSAIQTRQQELGATLADLESTSRHQRSRTKRPPVRPSAKAAQQEAARLEEALRGTAERLAVNARESAARER